MAIAFDAASGAFVNPGTSRTVSHTCSGSDRALVVNAVGATNNSDVITGVTVNGAAMMLVEKGFDGSVGRYLYAYLMINPPSGVVTIAASASVSSFIEVNAASYTGVKQTGQPEASAEAYSTSVVDRSVSVTTLTDGAWVVGSGLGQAGTLSAGSDTTLRNSALVGAIVDSGGPVSPAASKTLNLHQAGGSNSMGLIGVVLAPADPPALSGNVTLDDIAPAGTLADGGASGISGNVNLADVVPSGGLADSGASGITGNVTLDAVAPAGTLSTQPGVITTSAFKNKFSGAPMPGFTVAKVAVMRVTDMATVLTLVDVATNGAAVMQLSNYTLAPGQQYLVITCNSDGSAYGAEVCTAA